ncbi:MAG: DUF1016 domain-containing protein, partial [Actinomycetota bacterium]|nr:DUF1016 domain-containing protein [Actinomycetota bacterium]
MRFDVDGDGDELVLALLLFSVEQLRYVVVELKIGRFDPAYIGQLGTYVAVVDDRLRRSDRHALTVGILLCKGRNDTLVRYALARHPRHWPSPTTPCRRRNAAACPPPPNSPPPSSPQSHRPAPHPNSRSIPIDLRLPGTHQDGSYGNGAAPSKSVRRGGAGHP